MSISRVLPGMCALLLVAVGGVFITHRHRVDRTLRATPSDLAADPDLRRWALSVGRSVYAEHCAACHRDDFSGDMTRGVPSLRRSVWLYPRDLYGVERTILYGIRSGHPRSRNLTDMPALVRLGELTEQEANDVVEYVLSLSAVVEPAEATDPTVLRGAAIYQGKGACRDCHDADARGDRVGAPGLTGTQWIYGGSRASLRWSVTNGRHGECPAWIDKLTAIQIRGAALYVATAPDR